MKNVVLFLLCATVFLSCKEEVEFDDLLDFQISQNENTISDIQLDSILVEKYGHSQFSFDERAKELCVHVMEHSGYSSYQEVDENERITASYYGVICWAAIYDGSWKYQIENEQAINTYCSATLIKFLPSTGTYGAVTNILLLSKIDNKTYYTVYDGETTRPEEFDCLNSTVKAKAAAHWNAGISYSSSTYVICKNDD